MEDLSPMRATGSEQEDPLTPRSKVAKMLADIDGAPTPSPPQPPTRNSAGPHVRSANAAEQVNSIADKAASLDDHSGTDTDDLDDVRKPRGRAARRMLGNIGSSPPVRTQPISTHESDDELYGITPKKSFREASSSGPSPSSERRGNGLFISPTKSSGDASDEELPANPLLVRRKLDLVARNREDRLAKAAELKESRDAASSDLPEEAFDFSQDAAIEADVDKIMSDASRPARKASKKALLEMERETQRMARQQALAHQMRVKKKFTTNALFAKFNFKRAGKDDELGNQQDASGDTSASSAPSSDGPEQRTKEPVSTPPSSPPTPLDRQKALVDQGALSKLVLVREDSLTALTEADDDDEHELPELSEILKSSQMPKAVAELAQVTSETETKGLKLARLGKKAAAPKSADSDDELEIVPMLPHHLRMFDRAAGSKRGSRPADSKAIHNLKHLSHVTSREPHKQKKGSRPSVDPGTLESQLRKRAKEQARLEQLERIEELKSRGIDIQTADEREKEAEAFENLLEKARQDAVDLRKAERVASKAADGDIVVEISDDEDEDDDYLDSGSEAEGVANDDVEVNTKADGLIDDVADESDEDADEEAADRSDDALSGSEANNPDDAQDKAAIDPTGAEQQSYEATQLPTVIGRRARQSRVVLDEDDEDVDGMPDDEVLNDDEASNDDDPPNDDYAPNDDAATQNDPFAAFNFGGANQTTTLMSPTQAFNATMQTPSQATQEDSFGFFHRHAPPTVSPLPPMLSDLDTQLDDDLQSGFVASSQVPESQRIDLNWETQAPETPMPVGATRELPSLNETPGWEPTQDRGLISPWEVAPRLNRQDTLDSMVEHETQSTVRLRVSESPAPSQETHRRGRLSRRRVPLADDSEDDSAEVPASVRPEKKDAFREMAQRRKQALTAVEKADIDREARQMMDEQAEESEDEYAGLGGDDFVAPETEQDRDMIDSSHVEVNERAIAAHFAERERIRQEEETSKLYKDLTTGMMRRNRASNAFGLDEDEDEMAVRRRQMRQQEEVKKRKALLKDENIASLANGRSSKGKEAFLKAIADDDAGDDVLDSLADEDDSLAATQDDNTQSQSQATGPGPLLETSGNKRKANEAQESGERPPAKQRRVEASAFRRPTSMLEVQESVSFLLEEPHGGPLIGPSVLDISSDSENDEYGNVDFDDDEEADDESEQARQNDGGYAPNPASFGSKAMPPPRLPASQRRTAVQPAVVDRLSLKRGSSIDSQSAHSRTAWAANPSTGGFKVPSLLRRATTSTATIANDRGVSMPNLSRENSGVKMGGSKKSSLAYQARAEERKAIVEASAKRRVENTARIAQLRRNSSALSRGLTGRFE